MGSPEPALLARQAVGDRATRQSLGRAVAVGLYRDGTGHLAAGVGADWCGSYVSDRWRPNLQRVECHETSAIGPYERLKSGQPRRQGISLRSQQWPRIREPGHNFRKRTWPRYRSQILSRQEVHGPQALPRDTWSHIP